MALTADFIVVLLAAVFIGACFGSLINVVVYRLPKMMEQQWLLECVAFLQAYFYSQQSPADHLKPENSSDPSHTPISTQEAIQTSPLVDDSAKLNESASDSTSTLDFEKKHHDLLALLTQITEKHTLQQAKTPFNLFVPRSHCPACGEMIPMYRNIPIFTWLIQRGRAYCCGTPISSRYFWVEVLGSLLVVSAIVYFGLSVLGILAAIFLLMLLTLAAIDFETRLLPDSLTLSLLWLGLMVNFFDGFTSLSDAVLGAFIGYVILWTLYYVHFLITKRQGMGFGDFKLTAALGAWLGWKMVPLILFIAAVIGLIVALCSMRVRNNPRFEAIPFGPSLCVSGAIILFYGQTLIEWVGY